MRTVRELKLIHHFLAVRFRTRFVFRQGSRDPCVGKVLRIDRSRRRYAFDSINESFRVRRQDLSFVRRRWLRISPSPFALDANNSLDGRVLWLIYCTLVVVFVVPPFPTRSVRVNGARFVPHDLAVVHGTYVVPISLTVRDRQNAFIVNRVDVVAVYSIGCLAFERAFLYGVSEVLRFAIF